LLYAVSCLPGCLSELSNDNNYQPIKHNKLGVNVLTNIDLFAFIPTRRRGSV